ncbi:MAG: DUF1616 domain-containing protein [Candidatus Hodarchaeota archaeon]
MNETSKKNEKHNLKNSNKHFEILLKISLIIGIIVISGFIIYYLLTPEPGFVTFGILNENQEAENYQKNAAVNETIFFYITVENYLNRDFTFKVEILKGNNNTLLSSRGSENATSYYNTSQYTLSHNDYWFSERLNISFSEAGANQIIIAELWQIKNEIEEFYNILWLRLNITN